MEEKKINAVESQGEKKQSTKPARKPAREIIAELKKKVADTEEECRRRIVEKDRYLTKVEQECDDRIANKDLVIRGLNINLEKANKRIHDLELEIQMLKSAAEGKRKGLFARLFSK